MLQTQGLSKRFGAHAAVKDLALAVAPGSIYGFLGPNGAGKTTTLRMLMGLISADSGSITLFGQQRQRPDRALKQRMGYVSQDQHFYPWMSVDELGRFVGAFYPAWSLGKYHGLLERLDVPRTKLAGTLSRGNAIKVALALAIAHGPELLLLDEPTSGLDPAARRDFLEIISEEAHGRGTAVLFSSHLVADFERCADTIGILRSGELIYQGPPEAFLATLRWIPAEAFADGLPDGVTLVRRERSGARVVAAAPQRFAELETTLGPSPFTAVALEDAFLAYVRAAA